MKKYYLINYSASTSDVKATDIKKAEAKLEEKINKNFPNPKKLSSIENTWLIHDSDVTSGEVWLAAYTKGLALNVMKVGAERAANLK